MDTIETIKKDKAYLKYKLLVKNWEKEFKAKNSRIPSKCDIKEASAKVRYAYKQYFQLKSAALENSLIDCEVPSEDFPIPSDLLSLSGGLTEDCPSPDSVELLNKLPSGEQLQVLLSSESITNSKPKGQTPISLKNDSTLTSYTENLSKKLFQNRTFNFRNPRKSFSVKSSQSIVSENSLPCVDDTPKEQNSPKFELEPVFHENEISVLNKSTSVNLNDSVPINIINTYSNICKETRQVNESWLKRASGFDIKSEMKSCPKTLGIRNINIQNTEKIYDYVENSETEDDDHSINKLKPALKKRKIACESTCDNTKNDSTLENSNSDYLQNHNEKLLKTKTKQHRKHKAKDENDQPPNLHEFVPFGLENDCAPRHTKDSITFQKKVSRDHDNEAEEKKSKYLKNENRIQEKIKNGTLNDNFVKINIEKKVFVRGKKSLNYSKHKKQQWKNKKLLSRAMEFPESGKILCFKCGQSGHMARYCAAHKGDNLLPLSAYKLDTIPSLQDMETREALDLDSGFDEEFSNVTFEPRPIPEAILNLLSNTNENNTKDVSIKPIYDYYDQETPQELVEALHMFGHESFRSGQEQVIKRILCGLSTLLILSTGSGKSLCYQLPAYIYKKYYKCVTLVISPLVSLMEDQVLNMPDFLKAGCLHTNQPPTVRKKIIQCVKDGDISVLLISPEALMSGDGSNGFGGLFKALPPIAFACIDEAHCVSQWSHNFRPSYLMICRALKEKLKVKCILGLTATASKTTITSIVKQINIPDGPEGVVTNPTLPDNLTLSVSHGIDKDSSLITLLNTEPVKSYSSIIIYCIRRNECERLAALLRSALQESSTRNMEKSTRKRKRLSLVAEAYHAGISAAQRKRIQNNFMDGSLRIIVATVAFGMGINKSDIRCIIHYNMPSSFESYVQEVGRAGRDGKKALCHVLINNQSTDKNELLKHAYSNTMDRNVIRKLLQKVFIPCDCGKSQNSDKTNECLNQKKCTGHEVSIPIEETEEELDVASENIATLLCYLELNPLSNVKVLNNTYTTCKIFSYGGPQAIIEVAKKCPPLAMACKLQRNKNIDIIKHNILEFPVIEVAAAIGWESGVTKYCLKNLEWNNDNGVPKRSQFTVQFHTLGFRIKAPGDLTSSELDRILDNIHETVQYQERKMVYQLEEIDKAFTNMTKVSTHSMNFSENNQQLTIQSNELKAVITDYFTRETVLPNNIVLKNRPLDESQVISDVKALIHAYKDCNFTGRSIARIFQGITSPNYPAIIWSKCRFWRSHMHEDFYGLVRLATQQLIEMKLK